MRGPATGDFSPFQLHHRISDPRGNRNEPCIRARRANENEGKTNQVNGRKGEKSTAKQLGNAPSSDRAIKDIRQPLRRHTSG